MQDKIRQTQRITIEVRASMKLKAIYRPTPPVANRMAKLSDVERSIQRWVSRLVRPSFPLSLKDEVEIVLYIIVE